MPAKVHSYLSGGDVEEIFFPVLSQTVFPGGKVGPGNCSGQVHALGEVPGVCHVLADMRYAEDTTYTPVADAKPGVTLEGCAGLIVEVGPIPGGGEETTTVRLISQTRAWP